MAQKVVVSLVDDLDESEADQTVEFALDGTSYEIDLAEGNAAALRDALARYVAAARRTRDTRPAGRSGRSSAARTRAAAAPSDRERNRTIRKWARREGIGVSERGRISGEVIEAYQRAH